MRCPQLVGRDQELADLLAAATAGVGVVRLLVGEAGVGKTRLLEELAGELPSGAVLWGRASTTNRTPYRPVVEVVLAGLRRWGVPPAEAGSPYVRVFGRWIPELAAGAVTGEIETMVLAEATLRLMAGWPKPLVVVFEDLHWADEETLSTFQYLAHNAGETGALVAGTVRTGEPVSSSAVLGQVRTEVELTLRPLSAQEVERMAQLCRPDQSVMPDLARRSGGLPLVIENLLDANPADARLADVIAMRCTRMSSAAQRALAVASIAGLDVPVELLGEVLPEPLSAIRRALDEAVRAELLVRSGDAYQFRHDLIRRAVFESMPIEDRREMAAAMAVRRSERAEWSSAAELWELVGDTDAAASCYLEAAGEAANAGAFLTAKAGLTKTVDLVKTGPIWAEATWRLMTVNESLGMADEVARIGSSLAATLEVADPRRALEAQLRIARAFQAAGRWQEASRRLDLVRARAGSDPLLLGMTKLIEARHLMDEAKPGSYQQAWELASETVDLAARATRVDTQCEALEVAALCSRVVDLDESIELLRTMLSLAERHGLEYWRLRGLNELGTAEMLRWAIDDRLQEALRRARAVGAVSTVVAVLVNLAAFQAMTGRHDAVLATVNEVEHVMGRVGLSPLRAAAVRLRGLARGYRSGAAAMEAEFESAARITPPDGDALALEWGLGRGMVALMEEDHETALRAFTVATESYDPTRVLNPGLGPGILLRAWRGELTEDELAAARSTVSRGFRWSHMWLDYAQAIVAGRDDCVAAEGWFQHAEERARPYPMFRALAVRRAVEASLNDGWGQPARALRDLVVTCEDAGMTAVARACRDLLRRAGEPAPRMRGRDLELPDWLRRLGITAREAEVLSLVRQRLTNREIAERLYISPRTVEKHVASLLTKTGAADRTTLARHGIGFQNGGGSPM